MKPGTIAHVIITTSKALNSKFQALASQQYAHQQAETPLGKVENATE
jgi:hypothetical protein